MTKNSQRVPQDKSVERVRHDLRLRLLEVVSVEHITLHALRVTLAGDQMSGFVSQGFDDHVKLIIPAEGQSFDTLPELGPHGPVFDPGQSIPVMRDYTPHTFDSIGGTLQLDFALHDAGPATAWALRAKPGDRVIVGGPRGSFIVGTGFDWHLLVGDETALPAIRRRLAELPASTRALAFIEVDGAEDEQQLNTAALVRIHWVHRGRQTLQEAVESNVFPDGACYAWIACESSDAKALRQYLIKRGVDSKTIKASAYWRRHAVGAHEVFD
jgi:NADPH-dependent ferric siderophore reductase